MTVNAYLAKLGTDIREAREALGLTQAEVAEGVGVSVSAISTWERGAAAMSNVREKQLNRFFRLRREALDARKGVPA